MARSRNGDRTATRGRRRAPALTDAESPTAAPSAARAPDDLSAIRVRAYELYQARGGAPGHALDDWLAAERQLRVAPR